MKPALHFPAKNSLRGKEPVMLPVAMKPLLTFTSILETVTGIVFIALPAMVARFLLGAELPDSAAPLARLAGVALLSLGIAWWPAGTAISPRHPPLRGVLAYNLGATLLFVVIGIDGKWVGPMLWPAALLHGAITAWCLYCISAGRATEGNAPV